MKNNLCATLLILLVFVGCAPTGNWEEDTIFFSPEMGTQRLAAMRANIEKIEEDTDRIRRKASGLEHQIATASASKKSVQSDSARIRTELDIMEKQLDRGRAELNRLNASNSEYASRATALQASIAEHQARVTRLRAQLALAISTR